MTESRRLIESRITAAWTDSISFGTDLILFDLDLTRFSPTLSDSITTRADPMIRFIWSDSVPICYHSVTFGWVVRFCPDLIRFCPTSRDSVQIWPILSHMVLTWSVSVLIWCDFVQPMTVGVVRFYPDLIRFCPTSRDSVTIFTDFIWLGPDLIRFGPELLRFCPIRSWSGPFAYDSVLIRSDSVRFGVFI